MTHQTIASQLVMTWKANGGFDKSDLKALAKLIAVALRDAENHEKRMWLDALDDKEAGDHVIAAIRTRFPDPRETLKK